MLKSLFIGQLHKHTRMVSFLLHDWPNHKTRWIALLDFRNARDQGGQILSTMQKILVAI